MPINHSENLSAQVKAARARAAAVVAAYYSIRQKVFQTQERTRELRHACQQAMLQCRATKLRSASERRSRTPRHPEARKLALAIAVTLSEFGIPAFVYEAPQDTAIQL